MCRERFWIFGTYIYPCEAGVYKVIPGEDVPSEGSWNTLYFLPGIHDIGVGFPVHSNKTYYIPGDSIVYGTFHNNDVPPDGDHILIYGHGTLSGDRLPHPHYADPSIPDNKFRSIYIKGLSHLKSMHPQLERQLSQFLCKKVMLYTIFTSFSS